MNGRTRVEAVRAGGRGASFLPVAAVLVLLGPAHAAPLAPRQGAERCLTCHGDHTGPKAVAILRTRHAVAADARTPMAQEGCAACHGPGEEHARIIRQPGAPLPLLTFGRTASTPAGEQNRACLRCHADRGRRNWQASAHERANVRCVDCHRIHDPVDPVREKAEQAALCSACHPRERADSYRGSAHPIRTGQTACADCHDPHGAFTPKALREPTLNQLCWRCHGEKRGPFLWPHAPVPEDCSLCHRAHGSVHRPLLNTRLPFLCQQCHSVAGHPSLEPEPGGLAAGDLANRILLGQSCTNCHGQVHGSNHPSGAKLQR